MTVPQALIIGAVVCAVCSTAAFILITAYLDRRGIKTPVPLMRWYFFRNVGLYRQETRRAAGRVGPLFLLFVIPINMALILVILALILH